MQALEFGDRAAELLAFFRPFQRVLERAGGNAHRHRAGADALAVVGVHQVGEAALEAGGRQHHHFRRHFQVLEGQFAFRHAAQAHGALTLADAQPLRRALVRVAHGEEAADAEVLALLVVDARKDQMQPRDAGAGDPVLFAVDDVGVAALVGARGHGHGVGAGLWLSDADGRLVACEHQLGRKFLLRWAAVGHHGRYRAHVGLNRDARGHCAGLGHFLDHQHSVEEGAALAAERLRNGHAAEAGLGQRLDDVPRILLVAVDLGRARAHHTVGEVAGARLQGQFVGGEP